MAPEGLAARLDDNDGRGRRPGLSSTTKYPASTPTRLADWQQWCSC